MAVKILQIAQEKQYDLRGVQIDLSRKTGVLIRQSRKGADEENYEGRLRQESMVPVAIKIREDADNSNIELYDEGAGISGTKGYEARPKLSKLYMDIANDVIGSLVLARADRLFRDKHFRNVSMFTELAEQKRIKLIVPGRAVYDFTKTRDLQAFQKEMQEAYNYIATQILYMVEAKQQKMMRGLFGGGHLAAPYVIRKDAWKDEQKPVIYEPWREITLEFFQEFYDSGFSVSCMVRYIENRPHLFPFPNAEDLQKYLFHTEMTKAEKGFTFTTTASIRNYLSNLTLGGFAKVGKDELGNEILLAGAFEATVPIDLLAPCYGAITGHYPDGTPFDLWKNHGRQRGSMKGINTRAITPDAILHSFIKSDDGRVRFEGGYGGNAANARKAIDRYTCEKCVDNRKIKGFRTIWSIPCQQLDSIVLGRLCEIVEYDTDMADRIRAIWAERDTGLVDETTVLQTQIDKAQAQIKRLDHLLKEPPVPLSKATEGRYIQDLAETEAALDGLLAKQNSQSGKEDPERVIPNFYYVLSHLPEEYPKLDSEQQKRMIRKLIKEISINYVSDHLLMLRIDWEDGVAARPDVALIWRGATPKVDEKMTDAEASHMREIYPTGSQIEIMQAFPRLSWHNIIAYARIAGAGRRKLERRGLKINPYHDIMAYQDIQAIADLVEQPAEQERMVEVINTLASETKRGDITPHWWFAANEISYLNFDEEDYSDFSGVSDTSTYPSSHHQSSWIGWHASETRSPPGGKTRF